MKQPLITALDVLFASRTGGAVNLTGIRFQLLYACHLILTELPKSAENKIHLEGLEDIDLYREGNRTCIQIKTSVNALDASKLWSLGILQNFYKVYENDIATSFCLLHNTHLKNGKLEDAGYWIQKFTQGNIPAKASDMEQFLRQISVQKYTEEELIQGCQTFLLKNYEINEGAQIPYLRALFFQVFNWSKQRLLITEHDIKILVQEVTDSFSKLPRNPALENDWIVPIDFNEVSTISTDGYFEGKAARPDHIVQGLPVRRLEWEKIIKESLFETNAVLIKSSSGQGKSTLLWQVAYNHHQENRQVYQMQECQSTAHITAISDFIKTRVQIGQQPIIVFDGLDYTLHAWGRLVEALAGYPVKHLITSREEDWQRYGYEPSKVDLKMISVDLSMTEAKQIFEALKAKEKIHLGLDSWQPAWEKIADKGLLIEYVYLLTKGQMMAERLEYQVKQLQQEPYAGFKIEILRLVATANIIGIKIPTRSLIRFVQQKRPVTVDQEYLLQQLENEYFVRFDRQHVEGLHPVRSSHLVDLLHRFTPIEDTLLSLLSIIEEVHIYDFFRSTPFLLNQSGKKEFYSQAAHVFSPNNFRKMVAAIDGLMHFEPYRFWLQHQSIFDEAGSLGGFQFFVYDTVPFNKPNSLSTFTSILESENTDGIRYLCSLYAKLSPYDISNSDVYLFVASLQQLLPIGTSCSSHEGLGFLFKWFRQLGMTLPAIIAIDETRLMYALAEKPISEAIELFNYYFLINPAAYHHFIDHNKLEIFAWFKQKTNTLSVYEEDGDIVMEYILPQKSVGSANKSSMERIDAMLGLLPIYKRYRTNLILLPFPTAALHEAISRDARKAIPAENLYDPFDVHINQIWTKTILDQYRSTSGYQWQEQYHDYRNSALEFARKCTYAFEAALENKQGKMQKHILELVTQAKNLMKQQLCLRKFPSNTGKYFEKERFDEEENTIDSWLSSLQNFISQLAGIFNPQNEQDRRLPVLNLTTLVYKSTEMQQAFETIIGQTYSYFSFTDIIQAENNWYPRLLQTIELYILQQKGEYLDTIVMAARSVNEWYEQKCLKDLQDIHILLQTLESTSDFSFLLPTAIVQKELLRSVHVGIRNFTLSKDTDFEDLCVGLRTLSKLDIHFLILVNVDKQNRAISALRFRGDYFERVVQIASGQDVEISSLETPLPQEINEETIATLPGIIFMPITPPAANDAFFSIAYTIWYLAQCRERLIFPSNVEKDWLKKIEQESVATITNQAEFLDATDELSQILAKESQLFLAKERDFTIDEIIELLLIKVSESINAS